MRTDTILALDPGLRELGFAVLRGPRLLERGVLPLRGYPADQRLPIAQKAVLAWVRAHRPTDLVWEAAPGHSVPGHQEIHRLVLWASRLARRRGIRSACYSAKTVRQGVLGDGWASKPEVARAVTARLPELRVHQGFNRKWKETYWFNLFDAAALALHHQAAAKLPSRSRRSG